jgi:hypothetical protein
MVKVLPVTTSGPEVSRIVSPRAGAKPMVSPLLAAVIAARKLPPPESLALVTVIGAARAIPDAAKRKTKLARIQVARTPISRQL